MPKNITITSLDAIYVDSIPFSLEKMEGPHRQDLSVLKKFKDFTTFNSENKRSLMIQLEEIKKGAESRIKMLSTQRTRLENIMAIHPNDSVNKQKMEEYEAVMKNLQNKTTDSYTILRRDNLSFKLRKIPPPKISTHNDKSNISVILENGTFSEDILRSCEEILNKCKTFIDFVNTYFADPSNLLKYVSLNDDDSITQIPPLGIKRKRNEMYNNNKSSQQQLQQQEKQQQQQTPPVINFEEKLISCLLPVEQSKIKYPKLEKYDDISSEEIQSNLKSLLKEEGIIESEIDSEENDEICSEIRRYVAELKSIVTKRNKIISETREIILPLYYKEQEEKRITKNLIDSCRKRLQNRRH